MKLLELFNEAGENAIVEADTDTEKVLREMGYSEKNKPASPEEPVKKAKK